MSILLKDIPIPKEPTPITIYPDGRWYDYTDGTHGTWTKLPEKHGRLIDGDKFFRHMNAAIVMMSSMMKAIGAEDDEGIQMELKAYRDIRDGIKDYETVIEAEGER